MGILKSRPMNKGLAGILFMLLLTFSGQAAIAGPIYFNVFNEEGESADTAIIVTYGSLLDMLTDFNPLTVTNVGGNGADIVGSGSDGTGYWNVFNEEGESADTAIIVTYGSLLDMLTDFNPLTVTNVGGNGPDIVGSGASTFAQPPSADVPEPATLTLLVLGLLGFGVARRRTRRAV